MAETNITSVVCGAYGCTWRIPPEERELIYFYAVKEIYDQQQTLQLQFIKAEEDSKKAQEESKKAQEESKKAQEESKKAQEESKKAQEESKKAQEESKMALEESKKQFAKLNARADAEVADIKAQLAENKAAADYVASKNKAAADDVAAKNKAASDDVAAKNKTAADSAFMALFSKFEESEQVRQKLMEKLESYSWWR